MIVQEDYTTSGGTRLVHTYSDEGLNIRQIETGIEYSEAYDLPNRFTYEEVIVEEETGSEGEDENE